MDVLTNKSTRDYSYTSRYATLPYYYHREDRKYVYGIGRQLSTDTEYVIHQVEDTDTWDSIALDYYGSPDLFWIILDYNRVNDSFSKPYEKFNYVFVPVLASIKWGR